MAIIAEIRFSAPETFLGAASRAAPDSTASVEHQAGTAGVLFSAAGGDLESFEQALPGDPTVTDYRYVTDVDGRRFYVATVEVDRPFFSQMTVTEGIVILRNSIRDGTWTLRLQLPHRESLATLAEYCRTNDITMGVDRLYVEDPASGLGAFGLTPGQRDALLAAKEMGYFEDPRAVTLEELAGELDVSPTALGRRMRRGLSTLIERTLEAGE